MKRTILLLIFVIVPINSYCQNKIYYSDYDSLIELLPSYSVANKHLQDIQISLEDSIEFQQINLQDFLKNLPDFSRDENRKLLNDSLQILQNRLLKYQAYARTRLNKANLELTSALNDSLRSEIKCFCKDQNLEWVCDRKEIQSFESCEDLTQTIMSFLSNKYK